MIWSRLLGLSVSLLGAIIGPDIPINTIKGITSLSIPPLSPNRDNPITFYVAFGSGADYTLQVSYRIYNQETFTELYSEQGNSKTIKRIINFPRELVKTGTTVFRFHIVSDVFTNGEIIKFFDATKIVPKNISLSTDYVESFTTSSNYTTYSVLTDKIEYYPEKFKFINFQEEQEQSYYNYLDIHKINLNYKCDTNTVLTFKECYIYLQNYNNWFDNIGTTFGKFRKIPLTIVQESDGYHFQLIDPLYINTASNRLFSTYQDGCLKTKTIYLPKNGFTKDTIQMNLNIKGVGFNESSISQTFLFSINRNYFGDCYNSEYCISATETETNFEYGEVEEH